VLLNKEADRMFSFSLP